MGVRLKTPSDARRIVARIINRAFDEGAELEYSGRVSQLMAVWLKAYEIEKVENIEKRLEKLEKNKGRT